MLQGGKGFVNGIWERIEKVVVTSWERFCRLRGFHDLYIYSTTFWTSYRAVHRVRNYSMEVVSRMLVRGISSVESARAASWVGKDALEDLVAAKLPEASSSGTSGTTMLNVCSNSCIDISGTPG